MSIVTIVRGSNSRSELLNDGNTVVGQLTLETKDQLIHSGILERVVIIGEKQ